jgi:hypothetical protein
MVKISSNPSFFFQARFDFGQETVNKSIIFGGL